MTKTVTQMFPIAELSPMDVAFGAADRIRSLMPKYEDIPKEFKHGHTQWNKFFADAFYRGVSDVKLEPREGVNQTAAMRHIKCVMSSFEPKHEHKEAAVAYLLNQWFSGGTWTAGAAK